MRRYPKFIYSPPPNPLTPQTPSPPPGPLTPKTPSPDDNYTESPLETHNDPTYDEYKYRPLVAPDSPRTPGRKTPTLEDALVQWITEERLEYPLFMSTQVRAIRTIDVLYEFVLKRMNVFPKCRYN